MWTFLLSSMSPSILSLSLSQLQSPWFHRVQWSQVESRCPTCKRRFRRVTRATADDGGGRGSLRHPRSFPIPLKDQVMSSQSAAVELEQTRRRTRIRSHLGISDLMLFSRFIARFIVRAARCLRRLFCVEVQVYQPSAEDLAAAMEPYANTVCMVCLECDHEHLLVSTHSLRFLRARNMASTGRGPAYCTHEMLGSSIPNSSLEMVFCGSSPPTPVVSLKVERRLVLVCAVAVRCVRWRCAHVLCGAGAQCS